jgi:hypothetical protein
VATNADTWAGFLTNALFMVDGVAEVDFFSFLTHIRAEGGRAVMGSELGEKGDVRGRYNGLVVRGSSNPNIFGECIAGEEGAAKSSSQRGECSQRVLSRVETWMHAAQKVQKGRRTGFQRSKRWSLDLWECAMTESYVRVVHTMLIA